MNEDAHRSRRAFNLRRLGVVVVVLAGVGLFLAACGGNGAPGVASASSSPSPSASSSSGALTSVLAFSQCMRTHGVANFPDPTSPVQFKNALNPSNAQSPAFQSAETACRHLLPGGRSSQSAAQTQARTAALLAFARCLRSHGFPNFPDPNGTGQLTHEMLASAGINIHQPAVLQAADACVSVTHGVLTKAAVARFAAGQ